MRKLILLCLILIMSACSASKSNPENRFEVAMRQGKDFLISGDYQNAVKQFDLAMIEKPTDKDAIALYDRAKKSLSEYEKEQKEKEQLKIAAKSIAEYESDVTPIANEIKNMIDQFEINRGVFETIDKRKKWNSLNEQLELLKTKEWYKNTQLIKNVHKHLLEAVEHLDGSIKTDEKDAKSSRYSIIFFSKYSYGSWLENLQKVKSLK